MENNETQSIVAVNKEITKELNDPHLVKALLATTFPGFTEPLMRQAIFEGIVRGFNFKNFLQKDVYAIKYKDRYSLVTSIDYARKLGMRSGVVGKNAPVFEMDIKKIVSCSVTVKRRVGQDIGEFTATVYFDEFTTGMNLWNSKPRTMIAKVAEMHALRMACPEVMAKVYTEEEFDKERGDDYDHSDIEDDAVPTIHIGDDHGTPPPNQLLDKPKNDFWEEPDVVEETTKNTKKK